MALPKRTPKVGPPALYPSGGDRKRYFHEYDDPEDPSAFVNSRTRPEAIKRLNELSRQSPGDLPDSNKRRWADAPSRRMGLGPSRAKLLTGGYTRDLRRRGGKPIPRNEPTAQGDQVPTYFPEKRGIEYRADRVNPRIDESTRGKFTAEDWQHADADPRQLPFRDVRLERVFGGKYSPEGLKGTKRGTKMQNEGLAQMFMKRKIMERGQQWVDEQAPIKEARERGIHERRLRAILKGENPPGMGPAPGLMLPEFRRPRMPELWDPKDLPYEMPEKGLRYPTG